MLGVLLSLVSRFTGVPLGSVLFGLGLVWLGWWLWREKMSGYKASILLGGENK
jgi:hypothetical protein